MKQQSLFYRHFASSYLILIGLITLAQNYSTYHNMWSVFWPAFLLMGGVLVWMEYFFNPKSLTAYFHVLIGSLAIFIALSEFVVIFFDISLLWQKTIAVCVAVFMSLICSWTVKNDQRWLVILSALSLIIAITSWLIGNGYSNLIWPLALILIGITIAYRSQHK